MKKLLTFLTLVILLLNNNIANAQLFIAGQIVPVQTAPRGVAAADYDGDHVIDLAIANSGNGDISILIGKGDGTFITQPKTYPAGNEPWEVVAADFNKDTKLDLAVTNANANINTLNILIGNGDGTFAIGKVFTVGNAPGIVSSDFDKDGNLDIALASNTNTGDIQVFYGNGQGDFPSQIITGEGAEVDDITTSDFNEDGYPDLAVADNEGTLVNVAINAGVGKRAFTIKDVSIPSLGYNGIISSDYNGDKIPDIATAQTFSSTNQSTFGNTVSVLLSNPIVGGNVSFKAPVNYTVGEGPRGVFTGDYNLDGKMDLSTANLGTGANDISILLGNGDGTFAPELIFPVVNEPRILTTADFNGDGKPDLAIPDFGNSVVNIYLNNLLSGKITVTPQSCAAPGSISVIASGGASPYLFSFNGGPFLPPPVYLNTENYTNLSAGNYNFAIKDSKGTLYTTTVIVPLTPDVTPPVAMAQNITVYLDASGNAIVTPAQVNNGSTDNCSIASMTLSQTDFTCANLGANTVTFTVTDPSGNASSVPVLVTVVDNIAPIATVKNITIDLDNNGNATVMPNQVFNGTIIDNCSIGAPTLSQTNFTCANVGANTVTFTVSDQSGNTTSLPVIITVFDNMPPLAEAQSITIQLPASGTVTITPLQINNHSSDNCSIASLSLSQTTFTAANLGNTPVTLTATDPSGNSSSATAIVTLIDVIPPVAVAQNITVYLDFIGNATVLPSAVNNGSSDNSGVVNLSLSQTNFTCANIGPNTVTLTVTDGSGNTSTATAIITVIDAIPPVVITQNITVELSPIGPATITASQINNGSRDNCSIQSITLSQTSFTCADVGANTVTLTVTDESGNLSSEQAIVTVIDNVPPVALVQNVTVNLNASGTATITPAQVNNGSRDNCIIQTMTLSPTSFTCSNIGANTVTLTVTDESGNSTSSQAIVTVVDNTAPVAVAQNITIQLNAAGNTTLLPSQVDNGSRDNCSIASETLSQTSFTGANIGNTPVILTVRDPSGNASAATAIVTLVDLIPPVAITKNITVSLDATGNAIIPASSVNNGSSDNSGLVTFSLSQTHFTCANIGPNTVTLTVTDASGNVSTATAIVTVTDPLSPTAITQNITVALNASGIATITPSQVNNGSSDNCSIQTMTLSQTSFTCSNIGANTVILTVADMSGNSSSASAIVTVIDNIAPIVVIHNNLTVYLDATGNVAITTAQVDNGSTDNCSIKTITLSQTNFTCANVGANTIIFIATDQSGNETAVPVVVTVIDNIAPVAKAQNVTIQLNAAGNATLLPSQVNNGSSDNCSIASLTLSQTSFTGANIGATPVTLTVTDPSGNSATATATVTLVDLIPPVAIAKNITVSLDATGNATVPASAINNGSSDNSGSVSFSLSQTHFTCANIGPNTVTFTVTDGSGNSTAATAIVTVTDPIPPVTIAQNITIALNANGTATITPSQVNNGSSDNCSIASLTLSQTSFTCSNIGTNTVTLTATDGSGNSSSAQAVVTLIDNLKPTVITQNITVELNTSGNITITPSQVNNGSTDNCGIKTMTLSPTNFTCKNIGTNTVTLTVTDGSGNTSSATAVVTILANPAILNLALSSPTVIAGYNTSCNVTGDGSINLSVTGGQSPYTIQWSNGGTGTSLSGLLAGTYSVTVTDKNTCASTQSIQLTRPAGCGCNPAFTIPSASSYICTQTLDGTSNPSVNGGVACVNNSFSGNINFSSGTLIIKGNATISSLTLNANSQLIVLGTLTASSISVNSSSASITTYGTMTATSVALSNGQWNNYGNVTITSGVTLSGQGKLVNEGNLIIKSDLVNGNVIQNYALLSVGGVFTNNTNTTLLNECTIEVINSGMVNDQGVQFQNNGTITIAAQLQFNGTISTLSPGSIISASYVTTSGSTFTDNGSGCALITLNGTASLTQTTFTGPIAFCDVNASGITTSNVQFNNGAAISCSKCSYSGSLANERLAANLRPQNNMESAVLSVYPNPAPYGRTAITLSNSDFSYQVFTLQGVLVAQGKSAGQEATLQLDNVIAGMYIIQVKDTQNNTYADKLVVQE